MKFSINKTELQNAVAVAAKGLATRSTLPVLSGIYLDARGDSLSLQATNLELSVSCRVPALVEEEGAAVVPGKLFESIVKSLPDAAVHLEAGPGQASLSCDASSFSIKTLDPADFPGFPHVDVQQQMAVPFPLFSSMVKRVARVVSRDESRAILTGVLVSVEDGTLSMVATDSYRLAITKAPASGGGDGFSAVISGAFLQDVAGLPRTEEDVLVALSENQIVITYQGTVLINRRIEGNYPNYRQLLPSSYTARVGMERDRLSAAVKRASSLGNSAAPSRLDIDPAARTVVLSSSTQDVGAAQEVLDCEGEGEPMSIAFNSSYLLDGLAAVETDRVFLEVQSTMKPGILRAGEGQDYLYLIMPVRIA